MFVLCRMLRYQSAHTHFLVTEQSVNTPEVRAIPLTNTFDVSITVIHIQLKSEVDKIFSVRDHSVLFNESL